MNTGGPLDGASVLIVEDEYFIASDLKRALDRLGATVIGPAADLSEGMRLAEAEPIAVAILDINLAGNRSFPIVDRLMARGIPIAFLTGYDEWALPDAYRDIPRIAKPFRTQAVLDIAGQLVAGKAG